MHFAFSEDQRALQAGVREFLEKECPVDRVRALWETDTGHDAGLWSELAGIGLLGLLAPEAQGGLGLDELDLVLLLEETGRAALPGPVVETAAVAVPMLCELGDEALAARWLPRVAAGDAVLAVGVEADPVVHGAGAADLLLLQRGDEVHAVAREAVALEAQPCADPGRKLARVAWTPSHATRVARGDAGRRLWQRSFDRGVLACAAQQLGVAQRLVDLAVRYAQQREQFGQPIGSFQAVKHALADVAVRIEFARPVVYRAAHSVAHGGAHRGADVSHARLAASAAALRAARSALQVHGALGYTWEQDLHVWMKRAWALDVAWGTRAFHRARVGEAILAPGAPIGPGGLDVD